MPRAAKKAPAKKVPGKKAAARAPKRKRAAHGSVTSELVIKILEAVSAGASLRTASIENGIAHTTALEAIERFGLSDQYACARDERADVIAEELIEIADVGTGDVQRDRLRYDARRWFAGKLAPKRYGERVQTEHTGPNGGAIPIQNSFDLSGLTADERRALLPVLARIAENGNE